MWIAHLTDTGNCITVPQRRESEADLISDVSTHYFIVVAIAVLTLQTADRRVDVNRLGEAVGLLQSMVNEWGGFVT